MSKKRNQDTHQSSTSPSLSGDDSSSSPVSFSDPIDMNDDYSGGTYVPPPLDPVTKKLHGSVKLKTKAIGCEPIERDSDGRFVKGHRPSNHHVKFYHESIRIKRCILNVFNRLGGEDWLVQWVKKNSINTRYFLQLMVSVMPKELKIDPSEDGSGQRLIIIMKDNADSPETVSEAVRNESNEVSGDVLRLGNRQELIIDSSGHDLQRDDPRQLGNNLS